jgi:hypothetical protein
VKVEFISILLLALVSCLTAVELEFIDTITLTSGGGDNFLKAPTPLAVTEDGYYLVPDYKDADIKIFDLKGQFVRRVGSKGHGPNELIEPRGCDYLEGRFVVLDMGRRAYMLYTRDKESIIKETDMLRSIAMGNDIALMKDDKVLVSGYKADKNGKSWHCYTYDFNTRQFNYLVSTKTKFGFSSYNAYKNAEKDLSAIGSGGYCDWWGNHAYFVWTGNLKIFKINLKTGQITPFGKKTTNYRTPVATERLKKALKELNKIAWASEIHKFSLIKGLYTNRNYLMLMYDKPLEKDEEINSRMLQFYSLDGTFINETQITKASGCSLYVSKNSDDGILYMLKLVPGKDKVEESYQVTRFKIKENSPR